jgi:hypothetical protein
MAWLIAALTGGGLTLIFYGLSQVWPPLAFIVGGMVALRVAWTLDGGHT